MIEPSYEQDLRERMEKSIRDFSTELRGLFADAEHGYVLNCMGTFQALLERLAQAFGIAIEVYYLTMERSYARDE